MNKDELRKEYQAACERLRCALANGNTIEQERALARANELEKQIKAAQ